MAKKSSESTKDAAGSAKAGTKKAGVKKTAVKAAPTKAKAETATKSGTPKAAAKKAAPKAAATKKAAPKKAAPKLNDRQLELLKKVKDSGEVGYAVGQKVEQRTIDALKERKLLKGAKNKETGKHHYQVTKAGEKHLGGSSSAGTSTPSS